VEVNLTQRKILLMTTGAAVLGLAVPGSQLADTKDQVSVDVELIIAVDVSYSIEIMLESASAVAHEIIRSFMVVSLVW
jgi:hypothetical protein